MDPFRKADFAWGVPRLPAAQTVCRSRILPMELAQDVTVVPVVLDASLVPFGGPIWHNWRLVHARRLCRRGVPNDDRPEKPEGPITRHIEEAVWGGTAVAHFGHFITDHSARLVVGALAKPGLPILVGLKDQHEGALPGNVLAVLDWYGIAHDRIIPVTEPMTVGQLWVAPQPEQMDSGLPPQPWIDRQTANAAQRIPDPPRNDVVYVSRAGLTAIGGRMAGEGALAEALAYAGVCVISPERLTLMDQLGLYLGAKVIVFAEGSALHGLQLLGRTSAHAVVLNRRPRRRFGMEAVAPRVHALSYVEATASILNPPRRSKVGSYNLGFSLPDMDVLLKTFAALGIDLSHAVARIEQGRDDDLVRWLPESVASEPEDWRDRTRLAYAKRLQEAGLAHILERMTEVPHET